MNNPNIPSGKFGSELQKLNILEGIQSFARELELLDKNTKTDVASFSSGAIMLDVFCQDRMFALVYSPTAGFGVDEIQEEDSLGISYKFHLNNLDSAKKKLKQLMGLST